MKKRNSSIEMLRIMAMIMIIVLHYFGSCDPQVLNSLPTINRHLYQLLKSCCLCGVNIFVLITGYFSVNSKEIKIGKIIDLLIRVSFWDGLSFILLCLLKGNAFSVKGFIKSLVPLLMGIRWFVKAYIILVLLIPFINTVTHSISKKTFQILLIICISLFSLWPTFLPHPPIDDYGYGFIHFVLLYLISSYIRMYYDKKLTVLQCVMLYMCSSGLVLLMSLKGLGYTWAYNNIFIILQSIGLFILFTHFSFNNKWINILSSHAFGVFLVHTSSYFGKLVYLDVFKIEQNILSSAGRMLINIILCCTSFYLIGCILSAAANMMFSVTTDKITAKTKNIIIESNV